MSLDSANTVKSLNYTSRTPSINTKFSPTHLINYNHYKIMDTNFVKVGTTCKYEVTDDSIATLPGGYVRHY